MSARVRRLLVVLVVLVAAVAVIASGSDPKAEKVDSGSSDSSSSSGSNSESFKVGDEVKLGDWTVKVWGVTDPYTSDNQFLKPSDGNRFVVLDTEVKNTSSDSQAFSSLLCFKLQDSENKEYTESITSGAQPGPPDGDVPAGQAKRGNVAFEVPTAATGLKLNFGCPAGGTATINLS